MAAAERRALADDVAGAAQGEQGLAAVAAIAVTLVRPCGSRTWADGSWETTMEEMGENRPAG
ncbi:hypothetical protein GCM10023086_17070 [Streptomyces venetus]|uniref:Uncharacterized protein n=1 Tax=Streptomyces venetus TaxID=1701086 RepID=A0ABP8FDK7_9ACTN